MSGPRPIPISNGRGSQRSSPASDMLSPSGALISHSLPADVHARFLMVAGRSAGAASRYQPPHAPAFGSLPAPSFMEDLPMEELSLPPPVLQRIEERTLRPASVIQFASSCPSDMGYLRQGNPMRNTWNRPVDDFDLSKSPALAAMSSFRDRSGSGREFPRISGRTGDYSIHTVTEELQEHFRLDEGSEGEEDGYLDDYYPVEPTRSSDRRGSYDSGIFDLEE